MEDAFPLSSYYLILQRTSNGKTFVLIYIFDLNQSLSFSATWNKMKQKIVVGGSSFLFTLNTHTELKRMLNQEKVIWIRNVRTTTTIVSHIKGFREISLEMENSNSNLLMTWGHWTWLFLTIPYWVCHKSWSSGKAFFSN